MAEWSHFANYQHFKKAQRLNQTKNGDLDPIRYTILYQSEVIDFLIKDGF